MNGETKMDAEKEGLTKHHKGINLKMFFHVLFKSSLISCLILRCSRCFSAHFPLYNPKFIRLFVFFLK